VPYSLCRHLIANSMDQQKNNGNQLRNREKRRSMLDNYKRNELGVIYQISATPFTYDHDYGANYNKLGELGPRMAYLRLGLIVGTIGHVPKSIMDVGYGNGDFLNACRGQVPDRYANDVSGYPCPDGATFVTDISAQYSEVISFFDVLEHISDLSFVSNLKCKYVVISLPECHYFSDEWFENWKHRKPNEHVWHFDRRSLSAFMESMGFSTINMTNIEDAIRLPEFEYSNILTGVFKKND
jgi:hypothetical protein